MKYLNFLLLDSRLEVLLTDLLNWRSEVQGNFAHGGYKWLFDEVKAA